MSILKLFFTTSGRIGREKYFVNHLALIVVVFLAVLAITKIPSDSMSGFGVVLYILLFMVFIYSEFCLAIKRLHDLDKGVFWFLIILIITPFALILIFQKGTEGVNKYGEDPLRLN